MNPAARLAFALLCSALAIRAAAAVPPPVVAVGLNEGFFGKETDRPDAFLPPPSPAALRKFQALRFGMFIHWGPVALTGQELGWSRGRQVPAGEYDHLYQRFNPTGFNADDWVKIAQAAGMRYIIPTAKHMDGFCLWDTKLTDYNIMHSPFKRDIVKELAEASRRHGVDFGIYYCIADWYSPWFPFSGPYYGPQHTNLKPTTDYERYNRYVMGQLAELLVNYGPVNCLWFDSMAGADSVDRGRRLISFARALQPGVLINNRAGVAGDYLTPEDRIGRYRDDRPWETCLMIGTQWSWKPHDTIKSFRQLLRALVYCAGGDGNLLLDVGPDAQGVIEPATVARLKEIGGWLGKYGESIYDTRGGPYKPTSYLTSTRQGNFVYLHIMQWNEDRLVLPPLPRRIVGSQVLTGGTGQVVQTRDAITVAVPPADRQPIDTLVRLELDGPALDLAAIDLPPEVTVTASATREPLAANAAARAFDVDGATAWSAPDGQTTGTLELTFAWPRKINSLKVEENVRPILIQKYEVSWWDGKNWVHLLTYDDPTVTVNQVTTSPDLYWPVKFPPITTTKLRIQILKAKGTAAVSEVFLGDANN